MRCTFNVSGPECVMRSLILTLVATLLVSQNRPSLAWTFPSPCPRSRVVAIARHSTASSALQLYAKKKKTTKRAAGVSGAGFGAPTAPKRPSKKDVAKQIEQQYGGTSPQDIAKGTQERIDAAMKELPNHVQVATQLYQQLQRWNARLSTLSVLEHANLPPPELEGARRAEEELERICQEYNLTNDDLHNIFQKVTWDASADAKAARALTGTMSKDITDKVDNACRIVANAVGSDGQCLDVGCGCGVLIPHLTKAGLKANQIYGVDLSFEMIRNAKEQHRGVEFQACDFQQYSTDINFDAVIFCSSLHDLPNAKKALAKAASLLDSGGKLVVAHPQGASHVARQHSANPVMVQNKLPDAIELSTIVSEMGLEIEKEPATPGSSQEEAEGYLAVLVKT